MPRMGALFSCCCGTEDDEGGEYGERTRLISECNKQTQVSGGMDTMVEDMDRDTYFQHTTILSLPCSELITVSSDIKLSDQNSSIIRGLP